MKKWKKKKILCRPHPVRRMRSPLLHAEAVQQGRKDSQIWAADPVRRQWPPAFREVSVKAAVWAWDPALQSANRMHSVWRTEVLWWTGNSATAAVTVQLQMSVLRD